MLVVFDYIRKRWYNTGIKNQNIIHPGHIRGLAAFGGNSTESYNDLTKKQDTSNAFSHSMENDGLETELKKTSNLGNVMKMLLEMETRINVHIEKRMDETRSIIFNRFGND